MKNIFENFKRQEIQESEKDKKSKALQEDIKRRQALDDLQKETNNISDKEKENFLRKLKNYRESRPAS